MPRTRKSNKNKNVSPVIAMADHDGSREYASDSTANAPAAGGLIPPFTGYGPSGPVPSAYIQRPKFDRKDWNVFEVIFETHLRQLKLKHVLTQENPDIEENTQVYDELILCLDHESIKAICHTAVNDGKEAYKILKEKYLGDKNQRVTNAINAISNIVIKPNDCIETAITKVEGQKKILDQRKLCDEIVLVGLFVQALPPAYHTFKVIISHGGYPPWAKFKSELRNFISNSFNTVETSKSSVMTLNANQPTIIQRNRNRKAEYIRNKIKFCSICNKSSHYKSECWHNTENYNPSNQRPTQRGRGRGHIRGRGGFAPRNAQYNANTAAIATAGRGRGGGDIRSISSGRGSKDGINQRRGAASQQRGRGARYNDYTNNSPGENDQVHQYT